MRWGMVATSDGTDIPIGDIVPAHATLEGVDYLGNPLTYGAGYPAKPQPRQSSALSLNGVDQYGSFDITQPTFPFEISFYGENTNAAAALSGAGISSPTSGVRYYTIQSDPDDRIVIQRRSVEDGLQTYTVNTTEAPRNVRVVFQSDTSFDVYNNGILVESVTGQPSVRIDDLTKGVIGTLRFVSPAQFFEGVLANVKINDTHFPLAVGAGDVIYATDGTQGTLVGAPSWTTQDEYHYNIENGFQLYENGGLQARYPLNISVTPAAGFTKVSDNPIVIRGHNNAETLFDFTNLTETDNQPPAIAATGQTLTDYAFGDGLANPFFKRTLSARGEDRHSLFESTLTGDCLEKANVIFTPTAIFGDEFDESFN